MSNKRKPRRKKPRPFSRQAALVVQTFGELYCMSVKDLLIQDGKTQEEADAFNTKALEIVNILLESNK